MEHLPPWLRDLPLPPPPPSRQATARVASGWFQEPGPSPDPAAPSTMPPDAGDEVPSWLREIQDDAFSGTPAAGTSPTPDWMGGESSGAAAPAAPSELVPDWLSSLDQPPQPPQAAPSPGATDWLSNLAGEPPTNPPPAPPAPPAPPQQADDISQTSSSRFRMPIGATDWLRSIGEDVDAPGEGTTPRPEAGQPASTPSPDEDESVPTWLREISPEDLSRDLADVQEDIQQVQPFSFGADPGATASESHKIEPFSFDDGAGTASTQARSGGEMPAWLRDLSDDAADATPGWLADEPSEPERRSGERAIPSWLQSDESVPIIPGQPIEGMPDWFQSDESISTSAGSGQPASPDWMAEAQEPPVAGGATPGAEVPAWLRGEESNPELREDVPAWLRGEESNPELREDVPAWLREAEPASKAPAAPAGEDMPAWLQGGESAPGAGGTEDVPAWLREAEPASKAPAAPAPAGEDMPAWLQGGESAPVAGGAEDVPAWLREAEPASKAPAAPAGEDMPAWLQGGESAPVAGGAEDVPAWLREAEPPAPAGGEDVPAWLREAEPASKAPAAPAGEDMPAWLQGGESAPVAGGAEDVPAWLREAEPPAPAGGEDMPAWLREAEPASKAPAAPAPAGGDVPTWLRNMDEPVGESNTGSGLPPWITDEQAVAPGGPAPSGDAGLPAWLRDSEEFPAREALAPVPEIPPPAQHATPPLHHEASSKEVAPAERERSSSFLEDEEGEGNDFFGGTDLPSWLRPREPEPPAHTEEHRALDWLSRLGGQEEEVEAPSVAAIATPVAPLVRPSYAPSAQQLQAADLLRTLIVAPFPRPEPLPTPAQPSRWQKIGLDRVLYVLLLLVALIGLLIPQLAGLFQVTLPGSTTSQGLYNTIAQLDDEDVVMLAYEWNAQRSSELVPLERAVTQHLIEQRTRMVLLSTDVQGTLLSFDLIDPLREAGYNVEQATGRDVGGRDYVLLGFRPGGDLALRNLAQNLRAALRSDFAGNDATVGAVATRFDGTERLSTVADLALIVVMADQPQFVQSWMEQVHSRYPQVPIAFLLPAEAAPPVSPYLAGENVLSLVGIQGELDYRMLRGETDTDRTAAQVAGRQALLISTFVALLLIGALVQAVLSSRRRKS